MSRVRYTGERGLGAEGGCPFTRIWRSFGGLIVALDNEARTEEDWQRILGRGNIDRWAAAEKGAAWLRTAQDPSILYGQT